MENTIDDKFFIDILSKLLSINSNFNYTKEDLLLIIILIAKYLKDKNHPYMVNKTYCDKEFEEVTKSLLLKLGGY